MDQQLDKDTEQAILQSLHAQTPQPPPLDQIHLFLMKNVDGSITRLERLVLDIHEKMDKQHAFQLKKTEGVKARVSEMGLKVASAKEHQRRRTLRKSIVFLLFVVAMPFIKQISGSANLAVLFTSRILKSWIKAFESSDTLDIEIATSFAMAVFLIAFLILF